MTKKRRNGGKNRKGRGHVKPVRCSNCGRCVAKDKAVKRFRVTNVIERAAESDMKEASVYQNFSIPKLYMKLEYCVSCAVHAHVVRSRPSVQRRVRTAPPRLKPGEKKRNIGKPMKAIKKSARRPKVYEPTEEDKEKERAKKEKEIAAKNKD